MAGSRSIGGIYASLSLRDSGFKGGLKAAGKELKKFGKFAAKGGAIIGAGIGAGIVLAMKKASEAETMQAQLSSLLKSDDAAKDLIKTLRGLNVESPLSMQDFTKGAKQLLGVRLSADETVESLDRLSNISMGNSQQFYSLVRAFGQVKSAGRLMGQEVLQFVNAGFNPLAEISDMTGESMAALKKRMEAGKISFEEVAGAIKHATDAGGLFNGMNAKIAGTFEGKINKMKEGFNQFLIGIGTAINENVKPQLDKLNDFDFEGMGQKLGKSLSTALAGLGDTRWWDAWTLTGLAAIVDVAKTMGDYFSAVINAQGDQFESVFSAKNPKLIAAKAFLADMLSLGATPERRAEVLAKNKQEWEESKNFQAPDFAESFDKYLSATKNEKSPLAEDLKKRAEDLMYEFKAEMARNLEASENAKYQPAFNGPPRPGMPSTATDTSGIAAAKMEVNDYQRRGLSLDGGNRADVKLDKQTNLLTEIRDGIRRMSDRNTALAF